MIRKERLTEQEIGDLIAKIDRWENGTEYENNDIDHPLWTADVFTGKIGGLEIDVREFRQPKGQTQITHEITVLFNGIQIGYVQRDLYQNPNNEFLDKTGIAIRTYNSLREKADIRYQARKEVLVQEEKEAYHHALDAARKVINGVL